MRRGTALLKFVLVLASVCAPHSNDARAAEPDGYAWILPKGFPVPRVPADNPMTTAKVELGRHLFYDTRMSVNGKVSCATCHKQELAFTDGRPVGVGATGEKHTRSAMSLVNVAYRPALTWSDSQMKELERQALVPMFGAHPVELGLREGDGFPPLLRKDPIYRDLFARAFPGAPDFFTIAHVTKAIASFERSIISAGSPWDHYHYEREDGAISAAAKRGEILFFSQPLSCFRCHGGFNFSGSEFHAGILPFTGVPGDAEKFAAPTLRNIAVTAPYMHNGSLATLESVLDRYAAGRGGRADPDGLLGGLSSLGSGTERSDRISAIPDGRNSASRSPLR
ncbi:MAG: cytochrome c peroxidase, partial [Acidobacteriota bacterium]